MKQEHSSIPCWTSNSNTLPPLSIQRASCLHILTQPPLCIPSFLTHNSHGTATAPTIIILDLMISMVSMSFFIFFFKILSYYFYICICVCVCVWFCFPCVQFLQKPEEGVSSSGVTGSFEALDMGTLKLTWVLWKSSHVS